MKNIFILALFMFSSVASANNVPYNENSIVKSQVMMQTDGIILIEKTDIYGNTFYDVIATVATKILPKAVEGICLLTFKNKAACSAVYSVSEALVSATENSIKKGVTEGIQWVANKGYYNSASAARTTTSDKPTAEAIYYTFQEYKRISCVQWSNVKSMSCASTGINSQLFAIVNTRESNLRLRDSPDEEGEILYLMPKGSRVVVLGFNPTYATLEDGSRGRWVNVKFTDLEFNKTYQGWAWENYLSIEKN